MQAFGVSDFTALAPETRLALFERIEAGEVWGVGRKITAQLAATRSAVHLIIKEVFGRTAARIRARGIEFERLANLLEDASAHWMRHTAGSNMADAMDLRHVRDNLGHSSISTTNTYLHTEDDQRHTETEAKHRLSW